MSQLFRKNKSSKDLSNPKKLNRNNTIAVIPSDPKKLKQESEKFYRDLAKKEKELAKKEKGILGRLKDFVIRKKPKKLARLVLVTDWAQPKIDNSKVLQSQKSFEDFIKMRHANLSPEELEKINNMVNEYFAKINPQPVSPEIIEKQNEPEISGKSESNFTKITRTTSKGVVDFIENNSTAKKAVDSAQKIVKSISSTN